MAEDVVLRLKAENEDLKRKLEESQDQVRGLRTEVEGLDSSASEAGDAFDQAAEELREQFEAANADLDRLQQSTEEAGESTEGLAGKVRGVSEAAEDFHISMAKAAATLLVVRDVGRALTDTFSGLAESLGVEADQIEIVTSRIEDLTSGSPIRSVKALFQDLVDGASDALAVLNQEPEALKRLADAIDLVGFDGAAQGLRDMAEGAELFDQSAAAAEERAKSLANSVDRLREQVKPSGEELLTDLRALRQVYGELEEGNQLTTEQVIRLGKEAERLLGVFELIGKEAPADLQELADRARQAAEAKEAAAKAAEDLAAKEKGLAESTEEAAESQEQLATALEEKTAAAAEAAREQLEALQETLDKTSERIGELAQEAADSAREAQQQATQVQPGQPVRQTGGSDAEQQVESLRQEIADLNEEQQQGLIVTEEGTQRLTDARTELIEAEKNLKDEAAGTGQVFYRSAQQAAASQEKVNDLIQGAREQVAQLSQQLEDPAAASSLQRIVDSFDAVTSQVGVTDSEIQAFAENFQTEVDRLRERATTSFDETAKGAEKGKEGVEKLGDAAKDATRSADELGKSTKTATEHAKELADVEIENLPASIDKATAAAQEHLALLDQILAKWAEISAVIAATG